MYIYAVLFKDTITTKYTKLSEIRNCFSIVPFTIKIYYILFKETSMCKKKPTTENTLCSSLNTVHFQMDQFNWRLRSADIAPVCWTTYQMCWPCTPRWSWRGCSSCSAAHGRTSEPKEVYWREIHARFLQEATRSLNALVLTVYCNSGKIGEDHAHSHQLSSCCRHPAEVWSSGPWRPGWRTCTGC